ncbi:MAG TPA: zinc ribbon domain-containing protein [Tenuifilaceae bacterium]|nr:zinc ribbon domain-containing protein [Tenuifilaceae bacterium]HPE17996.1 zinc ribbon domain-containing protein [Tenuifilaceae bacterium]HPJ44884.1 zinc ribbon domain-containing protein [Tenuifilaceae bacterium]HPQ33150.1 zinc ribbon domain-containing protein [Tenuifilaceae bacterium]HRX67083.1 zinc ribbon domain-containing protein [Tenuifilaceae bacterium]
MKMVHSKQPCPKCGCREFELSEAHMTGGTFTKLFNIQNRKFSTFTCTKCKYTEFYQIPSSSVLNFLDFFTN